MIASQNFELKTLSSEFTHHDAHAYSVKSFYDYHKPMIIPDKVHVIVADGFGNKQEVISIYEYEEDRNNLKRIMRYYGYHNSLGLMYQYATSFLGLRENQDEYKLLGAETYVDKLPQATYSILKSLIDGETKAFIKNLANDEYVCDDEYINVGELSRVKTNWHLRFQHVLDLVAYEDEKDPLYKQYIIAHFVQSIVENVMRYFIQQFNIKHILLAGGLFYNVKLNNSIMKQVDTICVIPLAGDQGATIGLYEYDHPRKFINNWKSLFWGKRRITKDAIESPNIIISNSIDKDDSDTDWKVKEIVQRLLSNEIVEIVCNDMEFGPRALCNTTTLALPTKQNTETINLLNDRFELMPMAPVMLEKAVNKLFKSGQYAKIVGSCEYMIITMDYAEQFINNHVAFNNNRGIMHKYPKSNVYSGRPQVIKDPDHYVYKVLEELYEVGIYALINTSYNVHGKPIVFSAEDAISDYNFQLAMAKKHCIDQSFVLWIWDNNTPEAVNKPEVEE